MSKKSGEPSAVKKLRFLVGSNCPERTRTGSGGLAKPSPLAVKSLARMRFQKMSERSSERPIPTPLSNRNLALGNTSARLDPSQDLERTLTRIFGYSAFRPGQESVCRAVFSGQDVLVVMPTGSGKSLCYQLPTVARGGTALIVSPLIALMEDQGAKLKAMGLTADRIHSGRSREHSRAAAVAYR